MDGNDPIIQSIKNAESIDLEELRRISEEFEKTEDQKIISVPDTNSGNVNSNDVISDGKSVGDEVPETTDKTPLDSLQDEMFTSVYEHPDKLNWIDLSDRLNVYKLVDRDGRNLLHLRNYGVKIGYKLEAQALRQTPLALAYCKHQTATRIVHALQRDFRSYLGIRNPNKKMFLLALNKLEQAKASGTVSEEECGKFLKEACNSRICDAYISNRIADINPEYIPYIPDGNLVTYKRYEAAILKNPDNIRFIPTNNTHREKLLDIAIRRDPRCVIKCTCILPKYYSKAMLAAGSLGKDAVKAIYDSMPGSYKGMFNNAFLNPPSGDSR